MMCTFNPLVLSSSCATKHLCKSWESLTACSSWAEMFHCFGWKLVMWLVPPFCLRSLSSELGKPYSALGLFWLLLGLFKRCMLLSICCFLSRQIELVLKGVCMRAGGGTGHTSTVWGVAFSGDGWRMVSCSDDCTLHIWACPVGSGLTPFLLPPSSNPVSPLVLFAAQRNSEMGQASGEWVYIAGSGACQAENLC